MKFEWDPKKAVSNITKHGISFQVALTIFGDPLAGTIPDPLHSDDESRFVTVGCSATGHILVVTHTTRDERTRIINARYATSAERRRYELKAPG